ncbi:MAG: CoA transferase [Pseudomonadota bacterium]
MESARTPPLHGLRVIDFTRVLAGPFCTLNLADLGAEVIKIENPAGGDDTRRFRPPDIEGLSTYFLHVNRNKKSVALDLQSDRGRAAARALIAQSDIVVENFRPGVMSRLGIDYESFQPDHPRLIYCSISGYGTEGTLRTRAGLDPVIQAECGLMALTGDPNGEPMRTGVSLVDAMTGLYAANMILGAAMSRKDTGRGQRVEICLFDTGVNMLVNFAGAYLGAGIESSRVGNGNLVSQPAGVFDAADGAFLVTVVGDRVFKRLCDDVLQAPELLTDARYHDNSARLAHVDALRADLNERFRKAPRADWIERLREAGIPTGEIRTLADALTSPEFIERDLIREVEQPNLGPVATLRPPMRLDETPIAEAVPAPRLGEHTEWALRTIAGYHADDIAPLTAPLTVVGDTSDTG